MENLTEPRSIHPISSALIFILVVFLGFFVIGPLIGFFIAYPFYGGDFMQLATELMSGQPSERLKFPVLILQGSATAFGLIAIPMFSYSIFARQHIRNLFSRSSVLVFGLIAASVIAFMFPNSQIIEWNANLNYDGAFWQWAKEREDLAEKFTKFFTTFNSSGEFLFAFFVIAVLPAVGEEFCFRGWLQPALQKATGNPHIAIWLSAALFSAFHFQFFGFAPRMLLGAMFGYFMYWSGNLWIPITAHFVNNGLSLVMLYMNQLKIVEFDVESTEAVPILYVIPVTIVFVLLMIKLKKLFESREESNQPIQ